MYELSFNKGYKNIVKVRGQSKLIYKCLQGSVPTLTTVNIQCSPLYIFLLCIAPKLVFSDATHHVCTVWCLPQLQLPLLYSCMLTTHRRWKVTQEMEVVMEDNQASADVLTFVVHDASGVNKHFQPETWLLFASWLRSPTCQNIQHNCSTVQTTFSKYIELVREQWSPK